MKKPNLSCKLALEDCEASASFLSLTPYFEVSSSNFGVTNIIAYTKNLVD